MYYGITTIISFIKSPLVTSMIHWTLEQLYYYDDVTEQSIYIRPTFGTNLKKGKNEISKKYWCYCYFIQMVLDEHFKVVKTIYDDARDENHLG